MKRPRHGCPDGPRTVWSRPHNPDYPKTYRRYPCVVGHLLASLKKVLAAAEKALAQLNGNYIEITVDDKRLESPQTPKSATKSSKNLEEKLQKLQKLYRESENIANSPTKEGLQIFHGTKKWSGHAGQTFQSVKTRSWQDRTDAPWCSFDSFERIKQRKNQKISQKIHQKNRKRKKNYQKQKMKT